MNLRDELELKLVDNLLQNRCRELVECDIEFEFQPSWCSGQLHITRFATRNLTRTRCYRVKNKGIAGSGRGALYEIENRPEQVTVRLNALDGCAPGIKREKWILCGAGSTPNQVLSAFDRFIETDLVEFEKEQFGNVSEREEGCPDGTDTTAVGDNFADDMLVEGEEISIRANRYERNPSARAACLEAHGTACAICGFDFGEAYGPEFNGVIEVHHIVPLSKIGRQHKVDPVRDLIPVCPNCHCALHSKPGGVYTPDELRARMQPR